MHVVQEIRQRPREQTLTEDEALVLAKWRSLAWRSLDLSLHERKGKEKVVELLLRPVLRKPLDPSEHVRDELRPLDDRRHYCCAASLSRIRRRARSTACVISSQLPTD